MKQEITSQVVMLPTEKSNMCHLTGIDNIKEWNIAPNRNAFITDKSHGIILQPFDIYFTTDEDIKQGDWYIHPFEDKVEKSQWVHIVALMNEAPKAQKIIASTDSSLGLPAIPESFLKQYIVAQGSIKIVKLETEYTHPDGMTNNIRISKLKLTAANEVIVVDVNQLSIWLLL